MLLTELLHTMDKESKDGLINLDDWRWSEMEHLGDMGFEFRDDYHMSTPTRGDPDSPHITVYKKKEVDENGKDKEFFYLKEPKQPTKRFKEFSEIIEFFDKYPQPEIDKNK